MVAFISKHEINKVSVTRAFVAAFLALSAAWFLLITLD
jgi:hypothetical protein